MGLALHRQQRLFLDTAPFIYYFEEHPQFIGPISNLIDQVYRLVLEITTSMITYIELLTLPERQGQHRLAARYRDYLTNSDRISIYPLNVCR